MQKIIRNKWCCVAGESFSKASILSHQIHPEGLDVDRVRFHDAGSFELKPSVGHILSVIRGQPSLHLEGNQKALLHLGPGVHVYIPPGNVGSLVAASGAEFVLVSSCSDTQARGKKLLLRDEAFLSACASAMQPLRWIFTSQYLSRRVFLHHDQTLLSKSGDPVSWFRTTMFDVSGLPENEDGEPVFKMSYSSRTEFNVCYETAGITRVRMAKHPYGETPHLWGPWFTLDNDTTYHLNEAKGCPEEERIFNEETQSQQYLRNKHEVFIEDGYVSLFSLFDPAPTGVETHRPGEYSDYEALEKVICTDLYASQQRKISSFDEMVDVLSLAKAMGALETFRETPVWALYQQGRDEQVRIESEIIKKLTSEGKGRDLVIERWRLPLADNLSRIIKKEEDRRVGSLTIYDGVSSSRATTPLGQPNVGG